MSDRPDCLQCRHFFITYEAARPRGCRAYGFKSRQMPDRVVFASSGQKCRLFSPRPSGKGK
ncbi:MAG TPA: hypothetical protein ENI88_01870 [Desulfobulbus sp.]|nr:hypothetical protein [Desulfobulbus sp.]